MAGNVGGAKRSKAGGRVAAASLDAMTIELATGLSVADFETLASDGRSEARALVAEKFARQFDRLARDGINKLCLDLLDIFSKDPDIVVRSLFAKSIRASLYLPLAIVQRLCRDEIAVAGDTLRDSPILDDTFLGEIVQSMPEAYALAIADRRPLGEDVVDTLIEYKGTKRVVVRLLDNNGAHFSDSALLKMSDWGHSDKDIADRLRRRPNLPFAFVNRGVLELADSVAWRSLGERTMSKFEATQLQDRFEGKAGVRCSQKGQRFVRLRSALKEAFERGELVPSTLLGYLRDRDIDRLECGFSVMAGLDLKWVRTLLYGSDRRGLIVLCLKAAFTTADYLAFRMALSLAELGRDRHQTEQRYSENAMKFASDQYDKMRSDPRELKRWLPPGAA
ncbi:MAG: DUF2336 domain-containing protein [Pseudomonadota bacterium]